MIWIQVSTCCISESVNCCLSVSAFAKSTDAWNVDWLLSDIVVVTESNLINGLCSKEKQYSIFPVLLFNFV